MNEQLKALVWKLDREVWAKVEAKEATTSWAREESAKLIQAYSDQQNKVTGETSDGYHTFNELYEHRHVLFLALLKTRTDAWKSWKHEDGSAFEGWFIAGIGDKITYHIPARLWDAFAVQELPKAPKWDGHTSNDVIERLKLLDADQQNKEKDAEIQRLTEDLQQARNSAEIAANLHGEKVNEIQRLTKEVDELTTRARHAEKQLLRVLSLADEESKPLELSDEEIKAQTDSLYYILSDSERALYTDAAEWYRSRVRVDLERFGVALLDWYFRDLKRENISTAVEHNTLKFFLQSPEFEKWSKETLKS